MRLPMIRLLAVTVMLSTPLFSSGCALLPKTRTILPQTQPQPQAQPPHPPQAGKPSVRWFQRLIHPFGTPKPPPPRAVPLRRIGTVRTLSNDGSYVIVELEPGMMVQAGMDLVITATGGAPARLRVSEIQPPYFIADLKGGKAEPGDPVQQ